MGGKWNLEALFSLHFADPGGKIEGYFPPIFWTLGGKWDVVSPHLDVFSPHYGRNKLTAAENLKILHI